MSTSERPTTASIVSMAAAKTTSSYLRKVFGLYSGTHAPRSVVSLKTHSPEHFPYLCFKTRAGEDSARVRCSQKKRG